MLHTVGERKKISYHRVRDASDAHWSAVGRHQQSYPAITSERDER